MADIALSFLTKAYGDQAVLRGIDLSIAAGEFVVLVGPSGCGKSTTLRLVAGLEEVTGGRIEIGGRDVTHLEPRARDIAMVFQNYALYPNMTVAENLGFGLRSRDVARAEIRRKVGEVARLLGIEGLLDRRPRALSGGQQQRVAIGRAIVRDPKAFLFDEPLSNLDAALRVDMRGEILRLHKRIGATTLYVTHDQEEAMTMADRIVVMREGGIEQVGTPEDVFFRPASRMVAEFIGSPRMNLVPVSVADDATLATPFGRFEVARPEAMPREVVVGVRPDDLACRPAEATEAGAARIALIEHLGPRAIVTAVLAGGEQARAVVPQADISALRAADHVALRVAAGALHVFDADTGRRCPAQLSEVGTA